MANETTSTTLSDIVDTLIADAIFTFKQAGVMPGLVQVQSLLGFPGKAANFPKWDAWASSDVAAGTEGNEYTTNKAVATSVVSGTVAEKLLRTVIPKLAVDSATENVMAGIGAVMGNAMALKLDDDGVNLFGALDGVVAGAGVTLSLDHFQDATRLLRVAGAPAPYNGVFSPKQINGAKGISSFFDASNVSNTSVSSIAEDFATNGLTGRVAGINIFSSTEIDEDVATLGDAAGGIFSRQAIGLVHKGLLNTFLDASASYRGHILVLQGLWIYKEIVGSYGVYVLSDVA